MSLPLPQRINLRTFHKVVSTRPGMCDNPSQLVVCVENDAIGTRRPAAVNTPTLENREFVVCSGNGEHKAFVVMVNVWVAGRGAAGRVKLVARGLGSTDCAAGVAYGSTGCGTGAGFDVKRGGEGAGDEDCRDGEELLIVRLDVF